MATWIGNRTNIYNGYGAAIRIETQLAGQEVGNNRSLINWQCYVDFNGGTYAQLDGGWVAYSGNYALYNNGGRVANSASGTFTMGSGSFWVYHDNAGNASYGVDAHVAVYQSGTTSAAGSEGLPTIPRYANIDGFNVDWVTDSAIRIAWHADRGCDYISWWSGRLDGGGHHDEYVGNSQGWFVKEFYNLRSETTYDFAVAIRNSASGLWTTSGTTYPTTGKQNKFFDIGDF